MRTPRIAISYRRADSSAIAGRIFDRLTAHYGDNSVFMDIEQIPFGVDFRVHIQKILASTDVLITLIGSNWLGVGSDGAMRMSEKSDPVSMEIEAAVERNIQIIPVLIDGAKMPDSADLPSAFSNFAFLNAAEVSSGRDFRPHMERLIGAIDRILAPHTKAAHLAAPKRQVGVTPIDAPARPLWRTDRLLLLFGALAVLLVGHYLVLVNNLSNGYLWLTSIVVPLAFGFALLWIGRCSVLAAIAAAIALGIIGDAGMTLSASLISGDPVLPQDRLEWRDNIQFAGTIALAVMLGYGLACAFQLSWNRRTGKI